jgi:hypothetical protein
MKIDFFVTQQGPGTEHCSALLSFLEEQGHEVVAADISAVIEEDACRRDCDIVISYAIGGTQGKIKDKALGMGKPVVVMELGYLGNRYQNIGLSLLHGKGDRIHNNNGYFLGSARRPGDRLDALGIGLETHDLAPVGKALLLGQVPGDSQLGGKNIITWARDMMSQMNQAGYEVTFRPHPGVIKPDHTLQEEIMSHNITAGYNSTALVECIRLGAPFVCDADCQYISMSTGDLMRPTSQPMADRSQFLANLAYCQHNAEQFRNGDAWAHIQALMRLRGV